MKPSSDQGWSPYLAGALSGVVIILSAWLTGNYFGASTTFARTAGVFESFILPDHFAGLEYFKIVAPIVDWQVVFVMGILFGALLSAVTSNSFQLQAIPDLWAKRFGPSRLKRGLAAFGGGVIAMYGARLAGGCPSGHGLGGAMQMGISGYTALICFFIGGIVVAQTLYRGRANS